MDQPLEVFLLRQNLLHNEHTDNEFPKSGALNLQF